MDRTVRAVIEGAQHSEYELRTVRKLIAGDFGGKSRLLLTGVLDVVVQQHDALSYRYAWQWKDRSILDGSAVSSPTNAAPGDLEIWDFNATKFKTPYKVDYVRQVLTFAALYRDQTGNVPSRCVIFFINETDRAKRLLAIEMDRELLEFAVSWTLEEVRRLRQTVLAFQSQPLDVRGGSRDRLSRPPSKRIDQELAQQCTTCGQRFDCDEYLAYVGGPKKADVRLSNVFKN